MSRAMARVDIPIVPVAGFARAFPPVLGGFFAIALVTVLMLALVGGLDARVLIGTVPALLVGIAVTCWLGWAMRHPRVALADGKLVVGRLPRLRAPARDFDLDAARGTDAALQPTFRLLGASLPGYRAGWFQLRSGGRAFLLVTDPCRVLVLPRRDAAPLLLSAARPEAVLEALRRAA
jgi:Bacterial PH domain